MDPLTELGQLLTRRHFFGRASTGLGDDRPGVAARTRSLHAAERSPNRSGAGVDGFPNFAPKAKRVIYLFQSGAPSQMDLFDYKPRCRDSRGPSCPTRSAWASG